LATFFAAGFAAGFEKPGASDLLTGPGFVPALAASRMLAVSRCTFFFAPLTTGVFAATAFLAAGCFAAGVDDFFGSSAGFPFPDRAIARISDTLGRSDDPEVLGVLSTPLTSAGLKSADAPSGVAAGFSASDTGCLSALAAANMSATDIFFFSAMEHPHPTATHLPCTSGTTRRSREINERFQQHSSYACVLQNRPVSV
jgi:hypothetical protein